jgi:hypothetical protein
MSPLPTATRAGTCIRPRQRALRAYAVDRNAQCRLRLRERARRVAQRHGQQMLGAGRQLGERRPQPPFRSAMMIPWSIRVSSMNCGASSSLVPSRPDFWRPSPRAGICAAWSWSAIRAARRARAVSRAARPATATRSVLRPRSRDCSAGTKCISTTTAAHIVPRSQSTRSGRFGPRVTTSTTTAGSLRLASSGRLALNHDQCLGR